MSLKNQCLRALSSALKLFLRPHPQDEIRSRFLVVSTTGLGDTLWATPSLRTLRSAFPQAYIAVLTSPIGEEVLKNNPHIDELFVLKKPTFFSLLRFFFPLRRREIQTALLFHSSQRPVLPFCQWIGASEIIGTAKINKNLDSFLTKVLPQKPIHEIERRLNLISALKKAEIYPLLELFLSPEEEYEARLFTEKKNIPSYVPLVGIHPGSKDAFKRWPASLFIEVGRRLSSHLGCQILIIGDESERELVKEIANAIPGAIPLIGELPLRSIAALIKRMALLISNDTGPMHIGFAMNTPTVALFSPTDPKLCGPYLAPRAAILRKPPTCTPCLRKKCQEPFCLLQISPEEVYAAALKLFYKQEAVHA